MYDRTLILEILQRMEEALLTLTEGTRRTGHVNELLASPAGRLMLDGICMNLIVIGEDVKNLDRYSRQALLPSYPSIAWRKIMGMRDVIAHHYFEVDADKVFDTLRNDIPPLLTTIQQMIKDQQEQMSGKQNVEM
jgi:uncharacterized protein with HEPN domain